MDEQVVAWKGASVFAKLPANDSWITPFEFERLGPRTLYHKVLWACGCITYAPTLGLVASLATTAALLASTFAARIVAAAVAVPPTALPRIERTASSSPTPGALAAVVAVGVAPARLGAAGIGRPVPALALGQLQLTLLENGRVLFAGANNPGVHALEDFHDTNHTADFRSLGRGDIRKGWSQGQGGYLKNDGDLEFHAGG
ncbi:hypothetical protein NLG97_g8576 [Lecanicillium saksenae]|uniref:Uncharacterized protein n=1 Tax=Lecanicillium saksenae TaxID=468837 RepID=A0ACC1QIH9_9HYPO|nr:hypothetical protein NLG97_g8576 [Lecanicillium saksenae]